jgi:hypothetical protein
MILVVDMLVRTKGHKGELEYKQVKWWQRPLLTCMLTPRINKRIWLTNR